MHAHPPPAARPAAALLVAAGLAALLALAAGPPARAHSFGTTAASVPVEVQGPNQPSDAIEQVERVHVVILSHLDVGYTGRAVEVINEYFTKFFPAALETAGLVEQHPHLKDFGYVFTSHPWLLSLYFDCPQERVPALICPTDAEVEALEAAIRDGVFTWQGNAFNLQAALMEPSLYRFSLDMAHRLDQRFDRPPKRTVSLRDVPGSSRAVLPLMRDEGYEALSIGVNGQVVSAALPAAFLWLDREGADRDEGVLTLLHPGGYGGVKLQDCVVVPGLADALCVWVTGDNQGPPNLSAVLQVQRIIRKQYPRAEVFASTFDAFVDRLQEVRDRLPVVSREIGDTWLSGPPADPWKIAAFRVMSRVRAECLAARRCSADDPALRDFSRFLLKAPEHTAGLSSTVGMEPYADDWSNDRFQVVRSDPAFRQLESSWDEQRRFLEWGLEALSDPDASPAARDLAVRIRGELEALRPPAPRPPAELGYEPVDPEGPFPCGAVEIGFDPREGAIAHLVDLGSGRGWASTLSPLPEEPPFQLHRRWKLAEALRGMEQDLALPVTGPAERGGPGEPAEAGWPLEPAPVGPAEHPVALFLYRSYDGLDFFHYVRQYSYLWPPAVDPASLAAFEKPGVHQALPRSRWWLPELRQAWRRPDGEGCDFLLELALPPQVPVRYGGPAALRVGVRVPPDQAAVEVDLRWYDKTPTRLPESLWMLFRPRTRDPDGWRLHVLDQELKPRETVVNGSRHLAAVWEGATYRDPAGSFAVHTTDASVLSPGSPSLVDFNNQPVETDGGMYFNLSNNVWNTNWPLWYPWREEDANARFRFRIVLDGGDGGERRTPGAAGSGDPDRR